MRPDLSQRTALSKSSLVQFDLCQTKSWFEIHHKRPFVTNEKVSFGSCVDAGVEKVIEDLRDGRVVDEARAFSAAAEIAVRDDVGVVFSDVESAIRKFQAQVAVEFDWTDVALQAHLNIDVDGLGEVDGHPDIIFPDNAVWDVKTGKPKKTAETVELGIYGLMVEATTGRRVPEVGYMYYDRTLVKPKWGIVRAPFTDDFQRWAFERASAFARAKRADAELNQPGVEPQNYTMAGGPKFDSLCIDCVYSPVLGGPCAMAYVKGEVA